ncbi:MAG: FtsW/RodA/SpoVE family cell cycle protein [Chitinophagales bacterium]
MQGIFNKLQGDRTIWLIVMMLSIFSLLAVYSSTGTLAFKQQGGDTEYYLFRHLFLLGGGLVLMYIAHRINFNYYSRIAQLLLYISVPLLLITLAFGTDIHDARRWLTVPIIDISFQTSDLAKLALIMYTARVLSRKQHIIEDFDQGFLPVIIPVLLVCILIMPADLSSSLLLFFTCMILMFIGRVQLKHMGIAVWVGATIFIMVIFVASLTSYEGRLGTWKNRIANFMDDEKGDSYQVVQSKIAIANGGLIRLAPGKSVQRNFLPHPYSDFIYAIIIEEYGLFGGLMVMILYLWLLQRAIRIFVKSPGAFGALLAVGLAISLVIQAMMNMAVTVDLLPVTGLTLPLISMGGTSLLFTSFSIGIILSVSRFIEDKESNLPMIAA